MLAVVPTSRRQLHEAPGNPVRHEAQLTEPYAHVHPTDRTAAEFACFLNRTNLPCRALPPSRSAVRARPGAFPGPPVRVPDWQPANPFCRTSPLPLRFRLPTLRDTDLDRSASAPATDRCMTHGTVPATGTFPDPRSPQGRRKVWPTERFPFFAPPRRAPGFAASATNADHGRQNHHPRTRPRHGPSFASRTLRSRAVRATHFPIRCSWALPLTDSRLTKPRS